MSIPKFMGYRRENGKVGVRNHSIILPLDDLSWIAYWTRLYAMHLKKWLCDERFTRRKVLIRYDRLRDEPHQEFAIGHRQVHLPLSAWWELAVCRKLRDGHSRLLHHQRFSTLSLRPDPNPPERHPM